VNVAAERELPVEKLLGNAGDEPDQLGMVRYWRAIPATCGASSHW